MLKIIRTVSLTAFFTLAGCTSIPPEAPELSIELGNRISVIEDFNITLLKRFFDQKRKEVDRFIVNEWAPEFAKHFFSNQTIADAWDLIVSENDKKQRLLFLVKIGPNLQKRINKKRLEIIQPLDDLERHIESRIRKEYTQARAMNMSITSFLLSASKVAENRNRYLEMADVNDQSLGVLINKTDSAVSSLLDQTSDMEDKVTRTEQFLEKVRKIHDSL